VPDILPFSDDAVAQAARLILAGQPVAVPTETVYGLAADATDGEAVARIYAAKGRPAFNPLIVHVLDTAAAAEIAALDGSARALADAFWPGPLTLVLPSRNRLAALVQAGLDTIAVRVPAHPAMRALLSAAARPLAAPSANRSGGISPTRAEHVAESLGDRVALILDDGPCPVGVESTIAQVGPTGIAILRPGPVTGEMLAAASGLPLIAPPDGIRSPGQLASHYAPAAAVRLNATKRQGDEWLIGFGPVHGDDTLSTWSDPVEAAARLFDALHRADASGRPIAVAPVPDHGLGAAINDRLRRAAAPR
jgi:L-threonylcarbamoyladenylate synthase